MRYRAITRQIAVAGIALCAFSACGSNASNPPAPSQVANVAANTLQLAVGTANIAGNANNLNVVVTYRQPSGGTLPGGSGTLVNTPSLTIPGTLPPAAGAAAAAYDPYTTVQTGPGISEAGGRTIGSTPQAVPLPPTSSTTSFGVSGGAFGVGLEPFNVVGSGDFAFNQNVGSPFSLTPYSVPLFDAIASDPNQFIPWGGPPAFDIAGNGQSIVGNGNYAQGVAGVSEGLDVFAGVAPAAGTYTLQLAIPATSGATSATATASMPASPVVLGSAAPAVYTAGSGGGGSFAFAMPSGASEAFIQVTDFGPSTANGISCNGSSKAQPVYYTLAATSSGTLTLGANAGPGGTPSICTAAQNTALAANGGAATTGDQVAVQTVAFDYPALELDYPRSIGNPAPKIRGNNPTDDVTISPAACVVDAGGGASVSCATNLPALRRRAAWSGQVGLRRH